MRQIPALYSFNHGLISALGLARTDQKRVTLAAETMNNWMARILGAMSLRPGLGYIGATYTNLAARFLRFIFATTDTALLELTNLSMRIWINDAVVTVQSVTTTVANPDFATNLNNWNDDDEAGGVSAWVAPDYMGLTGTGSAAAIRTQQVTVAGANIGVEHTLDIKIARGPVTLRVGTTAGGDDYVTETVLGTGEHFLSFTPTGDFYVRFQSRLARIVYVDLCTVTPAVAMRVATPWPTAALGSVTYDQSGDILFVAANGYQQRKISRRGTHSWSVEVYQPEDGPFRNENIGPITIAASGLTGNITLTASASLFRSTHVGALFSLTSIGQEVTKVISAQNVFSSPIEISSVGAARQFIVNVTNLTATGSTVTMQRSFGAPGTWSDVAGLSYTVDQVAVGVNDGFDNQIVFYRIGVKTGNYVAGTITVDLSIVGVGSIRGVARITAFSSATSVSAEVLSDLGNATATAIWSEGSWSDFRGWPTAVRLNEGRLGWFGRNGAWLSVSDSFESFDPDTVGDSGPINRTIGSGPVDVINWALSLQRLILGAQGAELSAKSSSLDEPLTPTNFNIKTASTQGSSAVEPGVIDKRGVFVDRSGLKVFEVSFDAQSYDYGSSDLTLLVPELGSPGITRLGIQRKPDTRIHCVRSDGVAMVAIFDKVEDVLCWLTVSTDGLIEDVVILPGANGSTDDQVYYLVNRTINGATVRYLEKWAKETECRGGTLNKQADSFILYSGAPTATITGLSSLEAKAVIVWGDGVDLSPGTSSQTTYTVTGGQITLPTAVSNAVIGLPYTGQWKSAKLGLQVSLASSTLTQQKRISHMGLVMAYVHPLGLQFGPDFDHLDDLPGIEQGAPVDPAAIRTAYDEQEHIFPGIWTTDARLCLQAMAPRPVTVLAAVPDLEIHG